MTGSVRAGPLMTNEPMTNETNVTTERQMKRTKTKLLRSTYSDIKMH